MNRLSVTNRRTCLANAWSSEPVISTELGSASPSGRTTNSTAMLSPRRRDGGTGSTDGVPMRWAKGSASTETYLDRLSERAAHAGDTGAGRGGDAPAHARIVIVTPADASNRKFLFMRQISF